MEPRSAAKNPRNVLPSNLPVRTIGITIRLEIIAGRYRVTVSKEKGENFVAYAVKSTNPGLT